MVTGVVSAPALVELTKKERPSAQARELEFLGIPYKPRSDGSLLVLWADVSATQNVQPAPRAPQIRLDA